jgi:signal peptidase I
MSTLALLIVLAALNVLIAAVLLWLLARWFGATRATFPRALLAVLLIAALGIAVNTAPLSLPIAPGWEAAVAAGALIAMLGTVWLIIAGILGAARGRAALVVLLYLSLSVGLTLGGAWAIKRSCLEAFLVPTLSNAPSVRGYHYVAACPHCRGTAVISAAGDMNPEEKSFQDLDRPRFGICAQCLKSTEFWRDDCSAEIHAPDRIVCNKLLTPRRWDRIIFRHPRFPETKRVSRLLGMAGEKVEFKDGALHIDHRPVELPDSMRGLEYRSVFTQQAEEGSWQLGADEFFVAGDFSVNSSDSRDYGPSPGANIEGIVTLIYWPPGRWAVLDRD